MADPGGDVVVEVVGQLRDHVAAALHVLTARLADEMGAPREVRLRPQSPLAEEARPSQRVTSLAVHTATLSS